MQWVDETGSTNADLLESARAGAPAGTVLVADHQTAGRGRLGRRWQAPPGGSLLASLLFLAPRTAGLHRYTQALGVAAGDACREIAGVATLLKWPNDVMVGDRKLAGVLAESAATPSGEIAVVVGIGLNVNWPPPLPADLAETMTALNLEAGRDVDRGDILHAMLRGLDEIDWSRLAERYRGALGTLGRHVRIEQAHDTFEGVAVDVQADGRLLVRTCDGDREVTTGDVVHLRDAPQ